MFAVENKFPGQRKLCRHILNFSSEVTTNHYEGYNKFKVSMELKDLSSNWKKLQASLQQQKPKENQQREKPVAPTALPIGVKRKRSRLALTPSTKRTKNGKTPKMSKHTSAEEQPISQEAVQGIAKSLSRKSLDGGSTRPLTASNRENEGLAEEWVPYHNSKLMCE